MQKWFQEIQDWNRLYDEFKNNNYQLSDTWAHALVKLSDCLARFQDQAGIIVELVENKQMDQQSLSILENMIRNLRIFAIEFKDLFSASGIDFKNIKGMIQRALTLVKIIHIAPEGTSGDTTYYGEYQRILKNFYLLPLDDLSIYLQELRGIFFKRTTGDATAPRSELVPVLNFIPKITSELLEAMKPGQIYEHKPQVLQDFQDLMQNLFQSIRLFQFIISNNFFDKQISGALEELHQIKVSEILIPGQSYKKKEIFGKNREVSSILQLADSLGNFPLPAFGGSLGKWTIVEQHPVADSPLKQQAVCELKVVWGNFLIQSGKKIILKINIPSGVTAEKGGTPELSSLILRTSSDPPREFVCVPFFLKSLTMGVDYLMKIIQKVQEYGPFFSLAPAGDNS